MAGYLRSAVPGVVAPAIPSAHEAMLASLLWQFDRSQWWPAQTHLEQQLRQLEPLIAHAHATVPFYRTRLPLAALERPLTAEGWAMVPVLTREDVQAAGDALRSRATPPAHGTIGSTTSSGSTGRPVRRSAPRSRRSSSRR